MKNYSNTYIFLFSTIMVTIVAAVLSFAAMTLKPYQDKNIELEKKKSILASINIQTDSKEIEAKYDQYIKASLVINSEGIIQEKEKAFDINLKEELAKPLQERILPIYIGTLADSSKKYIIPVQGKGLWGPIWGYIALNNDYSTIYGTTFLHKQETPGLGAEIDTKQFQVQFQNKKIFDEEMQFSSINVVKGGADPNDVHAVDAISGGTITSKGLEKMIKECLSSYEKYFKSKINES